MSRYKVKKTDAGILYLEMPEELSILEDFMIIDLNLNNVQQYIETINRAINENTNEELTGNSTSLNISKDRTIVYNMAIDRECILETGDLKEIISAYYKESIQYRIEKNIEGLQNLLDKTKETDSLAEILKLKDDLQKKNII